MKIIEIEALSNGAHRNQEGDFLTAPEGWAVIPEDMIIPVSYPFVNIAVENGIVTEMTAGTVPEPEPEPEAPKTVQDILAEAYTEGVNSI